MAAGAANVIELPPCDGDATALIQAAIDSIATLNGAPAALRLSPGQYHISREHASPHLYYVSNTASEKENPDQTKHIGLWLRGLSNVTIDGNGACFVTHGEMTPIVLDSCSNITLKNFSLTAADPSVPEFTVLATDSTTVTVRITAPSTFSIDDAGTFRFTGEGWQLPDSTNARPVIAQVFYPATNVTRRHPSPLRGLRHARALGGDTVLFAYDRAPDVHPGEVYQLRHGVRNEVCAFINRSKDITLDNVELNFLGNFGLVGQYSENLTYHNLRCRPRPGSGRTDAGFADFVQMSGCRGKITITDSYFEGAHDDPINIHGTHLQAVASDSPASLTVQFMHPQTFGFTPFYPGDSIEIIDRHTLTCLMPAAVRDVAQIDDYKFALTLDRPLPALPDGYTVADLAVENVTWTPEVEIARNYFARTPTRGILLTTRRKSVIEDNVFYRTPMSAILVSDDARGWYESGPVHDLTIRRNLFVECGSPVISIKPEIDRFAGPVHKNIIIEDNCFIMDGTTTPIQLDAADNVTISGNLIYPADN
ncbi:MAG: right-handed parallel beta-helix repeat-containing protein [Muribaculaceae bacterium]|nr:right-handed parallel beta-helix repeat-containing protein [Muribaculaceae bacterium]